VTGSRVVVTLLLLLAILGTGCVPGDGRCTPANPAGFFWGVWHGWLAPLSLVWHQFDGRVRIYEISNTGWWYDVGYYMAVISGFGGLSFFRRRRRDRQVVVEARRVD
jgi:hypothetical protein